MVQCHCDNQAVVAAVRGGYCKDPPMAHMLRCLFFLEAKFDLTLSAVHVPGVDNGLQIASQDITYSSRPTGSPSGTPSSSRAGKPAGSGGALDLRHLEGLVRDFVNASIASLTKNNRPETIPGLLYGIRFISLSSNGGSTLHLCGSP